MGRWKVGKWGFGKLESLKVGKWKVEKLGSWEAVKLGSDKWKSWKVRKLVNRLVRFVRFGILAPFIMVVDPFTSLMIRVVSVTSFIIVIDTLLR